ncbi:uncharacterized protein LOC124169171 [Ischnura elegans]|uniref:uncharacterized protein LOC124169171 n=1 Tax=Ischnura elegans TaxID=197161 RepID=UPI001ED8748C|nr:uncharacterized protein LOC124169171 [Ischnura elegans]
MTSGAQQSKNLGSLVWSIAVLITFLGWMLHVEATDPPKCNRKCVSGALDRTSCPNGMVYQENVAIGGCCPACVKFVGLNEECDDGKQGHYDFTVENGIFVSKHCSPGLSCEYIDTTQSYKCIADKETCDGYKYLNNVLWIPSCEPNGEYSPVQQKGDFISGRWFCYSQDGKRIFGEAWRSNPVDMTCACSREALGIANKGERSDISLHCNEWGNYERLQCDDGFCWCADIKTGEPQSVSTPAEMVALLPCYLKAEVGYQYLRECESSAVAAGRIRDILVKHGTKNTNLGIENCDPDGSYGSYQITGDRITCTWKDKTTIGSYACPADQLSILNCNCARDTKLFKLNERPLYLTCNGNGNYNAKQVSGKKSFCVDADGYPTTVLLDKVDCPSNTQMYMHT